MWKRGANKRSADCSLELSRDIPRASEGRRWTEKKGDMERDRKRLRERKRDGGRGREGGWWIGRERKKDTRGQKGEDGKGEGRGGRGVARDSYLVVSQLANFQ